jgi:hypothetical protein
MSLSSDHPELLKSVGRVPLCMIGGEIRLLSSWLPLPVRPTLVSVSLKLIGFTGRRCEFLGLF